MPVTYVIDSENLILTRCHGNTVLDEVLAHFDILEHDPACPSDADVLLDLSEVTSLPKTEHVRAAADRVGKARRRVRFRYCAIVVHRDALVGMIRMFEVFAEPYFESTRVLPDLDTALEWLKGMRVGSPAV